MRGFPKMLSSKADYINVKNDFPPEEWKPHYQALLDTMMAWYPTGEVENPEEGIIDATHRVEEMDPMEEGGEVRYMQYELRENPHCKLYAIGFTKAEVKKALGTQQK